MGLEFKHFVYLVALGSAIWAVTVSSLVALENVPGSMEVKSELTHGRPGDLLKNLDDLGNVQQVLNIIMPLGLVCILYLLYTYRVNPIGPGSMLVVIAAFLFAADSTLDAKDSVESQYEIRMADSVWWLSEE